MENGPKQRPKQLTKAAYATLNGWNRSYLSQEPYKTRIAPALLPDGKGGWLVDVAKADEIFNRETDTAKVRKPSSPMPAQASAGGEEPDLAPDSMDASRREGVRLKNETLALDLAERKGQTVPRAAVVGAAAAAAQTIRENIFALIPGLAERFASMNDAREIRTMMDGALRGCLESVSDDFMRRIQPTGTGQGQPVAH